MKKLMVCFLLTLVMFITLSACNPFNNTSLENNNDEVLPVSSTAIDETDAVNLNNKMPLHLYFGTNDVKGIGLEIRYIPLKSAGKDTEAMATLIVKELLKGPESQNRLGSLIPKGTKLNKDISIENGTATIDFSKEFIEKQVDEKIASKLTLYSIVNSVTEISEISGVRFTINGENIKEYKGSFRLDKIFPRNDSLLPKNVPSEKGTEKPALSNASENKDDVILQEYE